MLKETGDGSDCESSGCRDEGVSGNDANEYSVSFFKTVLPRLITHEQLMKRCVMAFFARSEKACGLKNLFSLNGMTVDPIAWVEDLSQWARFESFFWGVSRMTHLVWPFLYFSLVLADMIELAFLSPVTYRSSVGLVLAGMAKNEEAYDASLTSVLGNDRPNTCGFWVGFLALYVFPVVAGLISSRVNARQKNKAILRPQVSTQWIEDTSVVKQEPVISLLDDEAVKLPNAIGRLNRYAYWHEQLLDKDAGEAKVLIRHRLTFSRSRKGSLDFFSRFYAIYLQWSLGLSDWACDHIGFHLTLTPLAILACWDYWRMFVMKIMTIVLYSINRVECQDKGGYYSWLQELGIFRCDPCDLDFVDVKSRATVEGCFNRTLAYPREADLLTASLQSIGGNWSYLSELKLSNQNWTAFNYSELNRLLAFISVRFTTLSSLSLSRSDAVRVTVWQAELMAEFLKNFSTLQSFDSTGIVWPNESIALMSDALSRHSILKLVLDQTQLNDTGLLFWTHAVKNQVEYLSFSGSFFVSNGSAMAILPKLSACQYLDLSYSVVNQETLDALSTWIARMTPQTLVFSGVGLGAYNNTLFFQASGQSVSVALSACQLDDGDLMHASHLWNESSIQVLDLSSNAFGYLGFSAIRPVLNELQVLNLAYNDLTNSWDTLSSWLLQSRIYALNTSGVLLDFKDQIPWIEAVANSSVTHWTTKNMGLLDEPVIYASNAILSRGSSMVYWDLSNNQLSNRSLSVVFETVLNGSLTTLLVGNNDLSSPIEKAVWEGLVGFNSVLQVLDLGMTQLSDSNVLRLMEALSLNSTLKSLSLSYNLFSELTVRSINQKLRRGASYLLELDPSQTDNADYNYDNYVNAPQNNRIEQYKIEGISISVSILRELCQELAYMDRLSVSGVVFDQEQLALSAQVDIDGCPAAISSASYFYPSFFLFFGIFLLHLQESFFENSTKRLPYRSSLYALHQQFSDSNPLPSRR